MSTPLINPRAGALLASAAALAFAVAAPGRAEQSVRTSAVPVVAGAKVDVTRTPGGKLVAISRINGHRTVLGKHVPASLVDVDGNYVGYARRFSRGIEVRSIDARSGRNARGHAADNVLALEVRRTGTLVWIEQEDKDRAVYARLADDVHVLGTGARIDPLSLALADSTATTAHVYWTDAGKPVGAAVE